MPLGADKKSELILAEVKKRKSQAEIIDVDEEKIKLVIFSLQGDYYAFHGRDVKEIIPLEKITHVPGSPDFILGIINVRGDIESVLSIHRFLGLSDLGITQKGRIAIVAKEGIRSGVLVDSIEDVLDVPISTIKPPLSTLDKSIEDFVIGETFYNNRNVTILDVGKILRKMIT